MMTILLLLVCIILLPIAARMFVAMLPLFLVAFGGFALLVAVFAVWALATAPHSQPQSYVEQRYEVVPAPSPVFNTQKTWDDQVREAASTLKPDAALERNYWTRN
jgi:hypothetical protein